MIVESIAENCGLSLEKGKTTASVDLGQNYREDFLKTKLFCLFGCGQSRATILYADGLKLSFLPIPRFSMQMHYGENLNLGFAATIQYSKREPVNEETTNVAYIKRPYFRRSSNSGNGLIDLV